MVKRGTEDRAGGQSIEVGIPLLTTLASRGAASSLTSLAAAAGMTASKAHKYLISFAKVGLVRQEGLNGLYDLGPVALEFGLAALRRMDVIELAHAPMQNLSAQLDETVTLTIWSARGPTTVRVVENGRPVAVTVKLGGVLPILTSSNGRVFLAWIDRAKTAGLIDSELADENGPARRADLRTVSQVDALAHEIRLRGYADVHGLVVPGIFAYSAPIRGPAGLAAVMTVVGIIDAAASTERSVSHLLLDAAASLSRQIGGRP